MKSKLYSLLEQGILKKPRKALVTYRSLIEPVNADTTIGQFTLHGVISNDDPTVVLSDTINLYPSTDADHPYRTITIDLSPVKEITSVFYTLINPDNAFNLNCTINHIELISEQGNIPIGLGILEPEALAATSITATEFTANWTEIEEATGYKIDVSTDIEFTTFVPGYEDYDIPGGSTVSLIITELAEDTCHFYRVRAYNATFTSMNSNEIHVGDTGDTGDTAQHGKFASLYFGSLNNLTGSHITCTGQGEYIFPMQKDLCSLTNKYSIAVTINLNDNTLAESQGSGCNFINTAGNVVNACLSIGFRGAVVAGDPRPWLLTNIGTNDYQYLVSNEAIATNRFVKVIFIVDTVNNPLGNHIYVDGVEPVYAYRHNLLTITSNAMSILPKVANPAYVDVDVKDIVVTNTAMTPAEVVHYQNGDIDLIAGKVLYIPGDDLGASKTGGYYKGEVDVGFYPVNTYLLKDLGTKTDGLV